MKPLRSGVFAKSMNSLFGCLETEPFTASPEQLTALRYRSICREVFGKHRKATALIPEFVNGPGSATPLGVDIAIDTIRCVEWMAEKAATEPALGSSDSDVASYVIRFETTPTVLVSGTFYPLATFTGRPLDPRNETVTLSIIPGDTGGWAVFSWSKRKPKNSSRLAKSFAKLPANFQATALVYLVLEASDGHAISPLWFDSLTTHRKSELLKRFGRCLMVGPGEDRPPADVLKVSTPFIDWGPSRAWFVS
jgi:hypothetical protein